MQTLNVSLTSIDPFVSAAQRKRLGYRKCGLTLRLSEVGSCIKARDQQAWQQGCDAAILVPKGWWSLNLLEKACAAQQRAKSRKARFILAGLAYASALRSH